MWTQLVVSGIIYTALEEYSDGFLRGLNLTHWLHKFILVWPHQVNTVCVCVRVKCNSLFFSSQCFQATCMGEKKLNVCSPSYNYLTVDCEFILSEIFNL